MTLFTLRRAAARFALVLALFGAVCATATSAGAAVGPADCPDDFTEGSDMQHAECGSWRWTYVFDVGRHNLVDYQDLWAKHHVFNAFQFPNAFLWYAPSENRTYVDGRDDHIKWGTCSPPIGYQWPQHEYGEVDYSDTGSGICTNDISPQSGSITELFHGSSVTLPVFGYNKAFIARACGNFSAPPDESDTPIPSIAGTKFHDTNRNGVRDAGEPGLGGWTVRLVRDSSALATSPQSLGVADQATTAPDGSYRFEMRNHGPGTYHVEEVQQSGWVQTRAPGSVHVPFGAGSTPYGGNDLGNVENTADVVKTDWVVVDPPEAMYARQSETLHVRATLTNNGPAPVVDVVDEMSVDGPADCVIVPPRQSATRRLVLGQPEVVDFWIDVTCAEPSFHRFIFQNDVRTTTPGVTDPEPTNNTRTAETTVPVIDDADVGLANAVLDCPTRIDVDTEFTCTGSVEVTNSGPYSPANTDVFLTLSGPGDCTVLPSSEQSVRNVSAASDRPTAITRSWTVSCASRSYHPMSLAAAIALNHIHLRDLNPDNNTIDAADTVEVFEAADLSIAQPMRIACGARLPTILSFACDLHVTVGNAGPATNVATSTTAKLAVPSDCTATPSQPQVQAATLEAGESEVLSFHWDVVCTNPVLHSLVASATVSAAEPHAEDRATANNSGSVRWVPTDAKPGSEPSSVNVHKDGVIPVAILSTPTWDAPSTVVQSSLRYGVTGFEPSLVSCGGEFEDTNRDGYDDLVCRFKTQLTGVTCQTTYLILTGVLTDGTPFESQDPVNVVGCK